MFPSFHNYLKVIFKLRLNKIEIVHNFLIQHTDFNVYGYVVRFEQLMTSVGRVNTSLESVEISNNVLQCKNTCNQSPEASISALSMANTGVHFQQTRFFNNNIPAVSTYNSDLHFHGVNVFKNNTGAQCGGALDLRQNIYLHKSAQIYVLNNTALKYGGGICVDGGSS